MYALLGKILENYAFNYNIYASSVQHVKALLNGRWLFLWMEPRHHLDGQVIWSTIVCVFIHSKRNGTSVCNKEQEMVYQWEEQEKRHIVKDLLLLTLGETEKYRDSSSTISRTWTKWMKNPDSQRGRRWGLCLLWVSFYSCFDTSMCHLGSMTRGYHVSVSLSIVVSMFVLVLVLVLMLASELPMFTHVSMPLCAILTPWPEGTMSLLPCRLLFQCFCCAYANVCVCVAHVYSYFDTFMCHLNSMARGYHVFVSLLIVASMFVLCMCQCLGLCQCLCLCCPCLLMFQCLYVPS